MNAPVITLDESGHATVRWPDPPQRFYDVAPEVIAQFVGTHNRMIDLERWKAEAMPLLEALDYCHDLLPPDAKAELGASKPDAVVRYIENTTRRGEL